MAEALHDLVARELAEPVDPRVTAMAAAIAGRYGDAARAVLFYGSCLRQRELDGLMLDFYLIVSDYREAYGRGWLAFANRLIPPNVFPFEHQGLIAKYAVLNEDHFRRECGPGARHPSVYARFSQPSRLVWAADDAARAMVIDAISRAAPTLLAFTIPTLTGAEAADPLNVWRKAFAFTYGAELRAERESRPDAIIDVDPERYRAFAAAAGELGEPPSSEVERLIFERGHRAVQRRGKRTSVLRLAKAGTTFAGGIDYLAWKINRHAGTAIEVKPWQRRWPFVAALILLPRLLKRGAIR